MAMARMTRVDACDPELPPLAMMSGMKSVRNGSSAMLSSNWRARWR
jgi:hypothetical protein